MFSKMHNMVLLVLIFFSLLGMGKEPDTKIAKLAHDVSPHPSLSEAFWNAFIAHDKSNTINTFKQIRAPKLNTSDMPILFFAVYHYGDDYSDMILALIEAGANVNQRKISTQSTPLMAAASMGKTALFKILLDAGADIFTRNTNNRDVFYFIENSGHTLAIEKQLLDSIHNAIDTRRLSENLTKSQAEHPENFTPEKLKDFNRH